MNQGLAEPFAEHCQEIAIEENLKQRAKNNIPEQKKNSFASRCASQKSLYLLLSSLLHKEQAGLLINGHG